MASRRALRIADTLKLPVDFVTETIALLAIKGAGKTYAFLKLAEEMIAADLPVAIIDHVGVCWGLRSSASGDRSGLPVYVLGGEHGDAPLEPHAGKIVAEWFASTRASCVLDMSAFTSKADERRFVTAFCDALYRRNRRPVHVMIDETDEYAPQKPKGETARSTGAIEVLVRRGRARGIGITMATQRPAVLNKDVLTQAGTLLFGRVVSPQDRNAIRAWLQGQASAGDVNTIVDNLPSLPRGDFHVWAPGYGIFKRVTIGKRTTYDSSATPKAGQRRRAPKAIAKVDLSALSADMRSAREQQEQNDPSRLRKRIAELEQAARTNNNAIIHKIHTAKPAKLAKPIKVPFLTAYDRRQLLQIEKRLIEIQKGFDIVKLWTPRAVGAGDTLLKRIESRMQTLAAYTHAAITGTPITQAKATATGDSRRNGAAHAAAARVPVQHRPAKTARGVPTNGKTAGDGDVSSSADASPGGAQLAVLQAAAQLGHVNAKQLGVMLGVRAKGSTLRQYIGRLVRAGHLVKDSDGYRATDSGIAAAGEFDPLPTSRAELLAHWRAKLGAGGMRNTFDAIVGGASTDEEIADVIGGINAKGSTLRQYVGRLRRLGVVVKGGNGYALSEQFGQ